MAAPPIVAAGLVRAFGARVALRDVELTVEPGQIVGLAGPNGSGKTTLLRIVAGLLRADRGLVRVFGRDPWSERAAVARRTRFAFAPPALYDNLTAREHVRHLAGLGASRPAPSEVDAALERVGLGERAGERVQGFSFGMRQRLALAQALVPVPGLLVLDEPTDGLDPLAVLELRAVLADLRRESGVAVLLSSHLLIELDELVDELVVLDEGEVLFSGPPRVLTAGGERLLLDVDRPSRARGLLEEAGYALEAIRTRPVDGGPDPAGRLSLAPGALELEEARLLLQAGGVRLLGFRVERPSLERALLARLAARRGIAAEEGGAPA